jgi:hypothetical protein
MHNILTDFVATFRHKAATATDLLCHFAAVLSSVPIAAVAGSVAECSSAHPSPADVDSLDEHVKLNKVGANGLQLQQGSVSAVLPWLQRLQAWMTFPGIPFLDLKENSFERHYQAVQISRKEVPWLVSSQDALLDIAFA